VHLQTKEGNGNAVLQMTRQELIERLLETNEHSSFQFTRDWLRKQWTSRLRALLLAHWHHRQGQDRCPA